MIEFGRLRRGAESKIKKSPREFIQSDLSPRERLIWADIPISPMRHAQNSFSKVLFGVPFFGFAVFWTYGASESLRDGTNVVTDWGSLLFPLFGVPFLLIGAGMLLSPFWAALEARWMIYAVTDQRLIIKQTFPMRRLRSWEISQVKSLTRLGPAEGPGDLMFAEVVRSDSENGDTTEQIGFLGIDNPKKLEDEIRKLRSETLRI